MIRHLLLLTAVFLIAFSVFAQKIELPILLREGPVTHFYTLSKPHIDSFNKSVRRYDNRAYAVLQFGQLPTPAAKKELATRGIELLDYVPQNAYTISFTGVLDAGVLQRAGARALVDLKPQQKMHPALPKGAWPHWAVKVAGTIDVWVKFPRTFTAGEVMGILKERNIDLIGTDLQAYGILSLRIAVNRLMELADYPFIEYVQPATPPGQPLNFNSRNDARANVLNAAVADGGRGLNGEGIVMGIGDNSDVQQHADFTGRLINRAAATHTSHGTHVTGTAAGAGIIRELQRGYAPKATIVSQSFSGILTNAPAYVQDYGMVITNNSYGNVLGCDYNGLYDLYAYVLDQQAFDLPYLQHVFATGNSGSDNCAPFPTGFGTVLGGFQSAKNVLCVGNTDVNGKLAGNSSKGPVRDGRTKPEIAAMGTSVVSSLPTNTYGGSSGTSMAAPAVSGGLALLYQRYRQLHDNDNPKSGLMKALLCNGAADKGNSGPDFSYGFGWMDLGRSVTMLEQAHYIIDNSTQGAVNTHTINVPAGTAQLKVLLYWHDPAASLISRQALVNDLDLQVTDPAAALHLPAILDTATAQVGNVAQLGFDRVNNIEQVIIDQPQSGNYTIDVKGTAIAQNPAQEYYVVYDIIPVATTLAYPMGGEALVPGENIRIFWDSYGNTGHTYSLDYSTDGGSNWNTIATAVAADSSWRPWTVPAVATSQALIRITQNGTGHTSTSQPFTIIGQPAISLSAARCEGYIGLGWKAVAGATDYEVLMLRGSEMTPMATTTALSYVFNSLSKDSTYWVTVRARINEKAGRRANAISRRPTHDNCAGSSISNHDLKLHALVSPATGRQFTASALGATEPVTIEVKNLDDAPVSQFTVQYAINGGVWVFEEVKATIAAGSVYTHTFAEPLDASAVGTYNIVAVVKNSNADAATANDTLVKQVKHLDNAPVDLTSPFIDDMENAPDQMYGMKTEGLQDLDRYDFENNTAFGRLRTFVNTGMAYSGKRALTLDADRVHAAGNTNYLTTTYNLSHYNAASQDIRLSFQYSQHGQPTHPNNKVWIRGDDSSPWIEAYNLNEHQAELGTYKKANSIELSDLLVTQKQNFTGSFQIRWVQFGQMPATGKREGAGYTIDDITLFEAVNDVQLVRIDTPITVSCALSATTPITVTVKNSANLTLTHVPVKYRINNGAWITETIGSMAANATLAYTFKTPYDLSALGTYTLQALVDLDTDNYPDNDTAAITLVNSPLITQFPYLQNFESDSDYWYSGGTNSSWQYGTPASDKIKGAASGSKAWKTRLVGNYNDLELSYLYSPCFDVSTLAHPYISFSVALDLEDCGTTFCDGVWMEYSEDGRTWKLLPYSNATNWYNKTSSSTWSIENYTRWHVATTALPKGVQNLRLRFVVATDPAVNREGIAIDDVHIYDNPHGIYEGTTPAAPVTQMVEGNDWVHFKSNNQLIASIQPHNQNLGSTGMQAYIYTGKVRNNSRQYYHNRNLTIKPATQALTDSVSVRFYFLDRETDSLVLADGCSGCSKPSSAYELGISKYSDVAGNYENGTIGDNLQGIWTFIAPENVVKVPYDKGYYAEFKVKDFSEFWLSNGEFSRSMPLPVKLLQFTAQKQAGDVLLQWTTALEANISHYEIEVARTGEDLQQSRFEKIGAVTSNGNGAAQQSYSFTDKEALKSGVRYYRLKIVDQDGGFTYSPVRSVVFEEVVTWQVYPNPSSGHFHLVYQVNAGEWVTALLTDAVGRVVQEYKVQGNGFLQKLTLDLTGRPAGIYWLQVQGGDKKGVYRLLRQ